MATWTKKEVLKLRELYSATDTAELIKSLPMHSYEAMKTRAHELKLPARLKKGHLIEAELSLSDLDIGFLTGLIEGDGTISLGSRGYKKCLRPVLAIYNTKAELLFHVKQMLGGWGHISKTNQTLSKNALYNYQIGRWSQIKALLDIIKPCLVIKRRQAEIVLNFIETNYGRVRKGQDKESKEYYELRSLNSKGFSSN